MPTATGRSHILGVVVAAVLTAATAACTGGAGRLGTEAPESTGAEVSVAAGTGEEAFCAKVLEVIGRYDEAFANPTGGVDASDPAAGLDQLKQMGTRLAPPMRELAGAAPVELGPALDQMARGFEAMASGDLTSIAGMAGEMGTAGQQFGDYLAQHCQSIGSDGLDAVTGAFGAAGPDTTPPPSPTAPGGTGPAQGEGGQRGPYAPPSPTFR